MVHLLLLHFGAELSKAHTDSTGVRQELPTAASHTLNVTSSHTFARRLIQLNGDLFFGVVHRLTAERFDAVVETALDETVVESHTAEIDALVGSGRAGCGCDLSRSCVFSIDCSSACFCSSGSAAVASNGTFIEGETPRDRINFDDDGDEDDAMEGGDNVNDDARITHSMFTSR